MTRHTPGPWTMHPRFDDGAEVRALAPVAWCGTASTHGASSSQVIDAAAWDAVPGDVPLKGTPFDEAGTMNPDKVTP